MAPASHQRRLALAVGASMLLHLAIGSRVSGGPRGEPLRSAPAPRLLEVQLVPLAASPAEIPDVLPVREQRPERSPKRAAPPLRSSAPARVSTAAETPALKPPGNATAELPDANWYPARQLDVYPRLASVLDLRYAARGYAIGRTLLLVLIDEGGSVTDASVVEADPPGHFDDEAKRALLAARFTPAYRAGRAVRSRILINIDY